MQEPNRAGESGGGALRVRQDDPDRATVTQDEAVALAGRVMAAAADVTQCEAAFLILVGEFDAVHASGWWDGIGSTAHWLAWSCSLAPGTAREHVRVARALRSLPVIAAAFGRGELSYSKVRELTRLTGTHDEEKLLGLARAATASQLARTVCAYRTCSGGRVVAEERTRVSWSNRADGLVQVTAILLPEDGAAVVAALENAADAYREDARNTCPGTLTDHSQAPAAQTDDSPAGDSAAADPPAANVPAVETPADEPATTAVRVPFDEAEQVADLERRSRVSALVAMSNHWLASQPEDRSGADRTTVVIEIDAVELAETSTPLAEVTSHRTDPQPAPARDDESSRDVPAGTSLPTDATDAPNPTDPAEAPRSIDTAAVVREVPADGTPVPVTHVPAGTSAGPDAPAPITENPALRDVPAAPCRVRGHGGIDADTARRLACEAQVLAVVRGLDGEPLAVSRSKRFGTRAQRRALMVRDKHCQFPGCSRQRHLKIHHVDHWIDGGATDLSNLLLLCQHHHTAVHEGHLRISRGTGPIRWRFQRPDGSVIVPEVVALDVEQALPWLCDESGKDLPEPQRQQAEHERAQVIEQNRRHRDRLRARQENLTAQYEQIESDDDPRARRLFPVGGGAGFILANCVEVFFNSRRPDHDQGQAAELNTAA